MKKKNSMFVKIPKDMKVVKAEVVKDVMFLKLKRVKFNERKK